MRNGFKTTFAALFHLNKSAVENEILRLKADIELKSSAHGQFWNLLTKDEEIRNLLDFIIWLYFMYFIYARKPFLT